MQVNNHEYRSVPITALAESATNPRKRFDAKSLEELAASFKTHGILAPLLVRELEGKALGLAHPSVARDLNNLAGVLKAQGKYGEAEPLYQQALEILKKALGPDHPNVAASLNICCRPLQLRRNRPYRCKRPLRWRMPPGFRSLCRSPVVHK
jgi:hypothetical protein